MEITTSPALLTQTDFRHYFEKGLFYTDYLNNLSAEAVSPSAHPYTHYVPLNLQRSLRIGKTALLTDEIRTTLDGLRHGIKWLVISEHWCGDASQILPVLNKIAEAAMGKI